MSELIGSGAFFSPCRTWRYSLWRVWDRARAPAMFIGLNPSTADELDDDPTIRRAADFARKWDCGGLVMCNLYGLRSTKPKGLLAVEDPVGPDNDRVLRSCADRVGLVVAAWGVHAKPERAEVVASYLPELKCLGRNKGGSPRHPLYLSKETRLEDYA